MIATNVGPVPDHIVDMLSRSAEVKIDLTTDHAPHRLIGFLYNDISYHASVLQLNSRSPFSVRTGDSFRLYDTRLLGVLRG